MLIKEQRGMMCPNFHGYKIGSLQCEECNHWKVTLNGRLNEHGIECADEFCEILVVSKVRGDET